MRKPEFIDMKGLLSFQIMWILNRQSMCGEELIEALGKMRFDAPSPGTLYPALNKLKQEGLVESKRDNKRVVYTPTLKGRKDLELAVRYFKAVYGDILAGRGSIGYAPGEEKMHLAGATKEGMVLQDEVDVDIDYI